MSFAEDYIPVAERITAFYGKHPEGSLQGEMVEVSETRVLFRAYAYRTPDDIRPGIGYSSLEIPGKTPYTRGSEIENCETSAWGRAIAALGFEVKRGIASAEEVRNKTPENGHAAVHATAAVAAPPRSSTTVPDDIGDWDNLLPAKPRAAVALSEGEDWCPAHNLPWKLNPAGTSKTTGKAYGAFWACSSQSKPYCSEKPTRQWVEAHHP